MESILEQINGELSDNREYENHGLLQVFVNKYD